MQRKVIVSEEIVTDIGKLKVDISVLELLSIIVYELSNNQGKTQKLNAYIKIKFYGFFLITHVLNVIIL